MRGLKPFPISHWRIQAGTEIASMGTTVGPVLEKSGSGDETTAIRVGWIGDYSATHYAMLYSPQNGTGTGSKVGIKYATAPKSGFDHTWTKQNADTEFVIESNPSGDFQDIIDPFAWKEGSTWYIVVADFKQGIIGLWSGSDFDNMSFDSKIIDNTGSSGFNKYWRHPNVFKIGSTYHVIGDCRATLAEQQSDSVIGHASGASLGSLTLDGTATLDPDDYPNAPYGNFSMPAITKVDNTYIMMMFSTNIASNAYKGYGGGFTYAVSSNMVDWTVKTTEQPIVYLANDIGEFGDYYFQEPFLWYKDDTTPILYFWVYDEVNLVGRGIGYAPVTFGTFADSFPANLFEDTFATLDVGGEYTRIEQDGVTLYSASDKLEIDMDGSTASGSVFVALLGSTTFDLDQLVMSFILEWDSMAISNPDNFLIGIRETVTGFDNYAAFQYSGSTLAFRAAMNIDTGGGDQRIFRDTISKNNGERFMLIVAGRTFQWCRFKTTGEFEILSTTILTDDELTYFQGKSVEFFIGVKAQSGTANNFRVDDLVIRKYMTKDESVFDI